AQERLAPPPPRLSSSPPCLSSPPQPLLSLACPARASPLSPLATSPPPNRGAGSVVSRAGSVAGAAVRGEGPQLHRCLQVPCPLERRQSTASPNLEATKKFEPKYCLIKKGDDCMEELTDEDKAIASEVFEDDKNREMFMKHKNHNVRLLWFRRKIRRLADT
ncbi:hypothetical protein EJB05_11210, partial [Eragrostis curvula]